MTTLLFFMFLILSLISLIRFGEKAILYILPYNAISDTLVFFTRDIWLLNSGYLRAIVLMLFIVSYYLKRPKMRSNDVIPWIYIFIIVSLMLIIINSSSLIASYTYFLRVIIYLLLMRISIDYFDTRDKFQTFAKVVFITSLLLIIVNVLVQIFQLGESNYVEGTFYEAGEGSATILLAFIVISFPVVFNFEKTKSKIRVLLAGLIYLSTFIFVIFSFRRTTMIYFGISMIIQYAFSKYKLTKSLGIVFLGIIALVILISVQDTLIEVYEVRFVKTEWHLEKEGRYVESSDIFDRIIERNDLYTNLFGRETFNFSPERNIKEFGYNRQYHNIFAILLDGLGVFGSLIFVILMVQIFLHIRGIPDALIVDNKRLVKVSLYLLVFAYFVQIASFGFEMITIHSYTFMVIAMSYNFSQLYRNKNA
jgi:hypothetical protein